MADFRLTTSADTFIGTDGNDTVYGTAATLNYMDSLSGGLGTDILALSGSGPFRVDQLATFTGFESITLNNSTGYWAYLYLGNQSMAVVTSGGSNQVNLGNGAITLQENDGINYVYSSSASNWNAGNVIIVNSSFNALMLNIDPDAPDYSTTAVYDLTTNTLSNIHELDGFGADLTVHINSAVAAGVLNFNGYFGISKLITSDAALDLSHSTVSGFTVVSSNAIGTNFFVHDLGTALQVVGGAGTDTLTAAGFVFTGDQRNDIFITTSIEKIVDASGTYTVDNAFPTITSNGGGDTAAVSIAENTTAVTSVTATDPDVGQTLSYSISSGADASKFTVDTSTGALSFVTAPNFELPTDTGGNNVYDVIVQASDGHGGIDTQAIAVTVTDVNEAVHWIGSVDVGSHPPGYAVAGTGDFNGDGTNDVLWFNAGNGDTEVWKTANGQWAGSVDIGHHPLGYAVAGVGDFNNDGTDDVLWYNRTTTDTEIWKISDGKWAGSVDIGSHPAGWKPAGIGDFDHNGSSDVLWFNQSTGNTEIWKVVNGQWAGSVDLGNHPAGYTVAGVGDFNADGTDDVLWFNAATGDSEIWKINDGKWAGSVDIGLHPPGWTAAGVGDFNHDGTSDLLWFNAATGATDIWKINDGHWAGSETIGTHPLGWTPVGVGDLDHNAIPDVTWLQNGTGHIEHWLLA